MSARRVLVTGGTGFIGAHLVPLLVCQGWQVTVLSRQSAPPVIPGRPPLPESVTLLQGDITAPESYRDTLRQQDALVHLAADYRIGLPRRGRARGEMFRTNVTGTQILADEAGKAGIAQMLYVSSTAALGETHGRFPDEQHRHNGTFRSYYEETKHIAHGLMLARQRRGLPVSIAIPGGVFGDGDTSVLAQTADQFFAGKIPFQIATHSTFQLCHVSRLCEGLAALLAPDMTGRNYLFTGQDFAMPDIFRLLAEISGRPVPPARPVSLLRFPAYLMDLLSAAGFTMPLSREALAILDGSTYMYSSAAAQAELNWSAGDPQAGLITWLTGRHRAFLTGKNA